MKKPKIFERLLTKLIINQAYRLPPADGLRFLLNLDTALYPVKGRLSVNYGGGIHTKHRHTRYHDFFISRVCRGEKILDIGCGNGALSYDLAEKAGAKVLGIDINRDNIDQARRRHPHPQIEYRVGDAMNDMPQEHFDAVILSNILEHLPERVDFLLRVQSVIRPDRFLIRIPMYERDWQVPLKKELGIDWRLDPTHEIEYTQDSLADEMRQAGLKINYQEIRWGEIWAEAAQDAPQG